MLAPRTFISLTARHDTPWQHQLALLALYHCALDWESGETVGTVLLKYDHLILGILNHHARDTTLAAGPAHAGGRRRGRVSL